MSCIGKLSIQGIRSFSPDEKQVIVFFSPLTLILGPNGTGKTTIIECLKYMTTGELPPGGKLGAAFINDPKLSHSTEIRAQIRIQFVDVKGEECVAQRSITATQKKSKIEMRTLEGLLVRKLANGEKMSVSSKCLEMDREMVSMLGVSKAVLENVIFCHQEESNWPLSEGKVLKNKFDDIFASTKYVKALDIIRKFRQEQMGVIREYQTEIKHLKNNKDTALEKQLTLTDRESRHKAATESARKIDEKLAPIIAKLRLIEEKDEDMHRIKNIIVKLEGERSQLQKSVIELGKNIQNKFSGGMDELTKEMSIFKDSTSTVERNINLDQDKLAACTKENELLQKQNIQVHSEIACLRQSLSKIQLVIKDRNSMYLEIIDEFKIFGFERENITDKDARNIVSRIQDEVKKIAEDIKLSKQDNETELLSVQNEIDNQRGLKMKLETEKNLKEKLMTKNNEEIQKINAELAFVEASSSRLSNIKNDIQNTECELLEVERSVDADLVKSEIHQISREKFDLEIQIKNLEGEISQLTQESSIRTQLDMLSKDLANKEEKKNELMKKNEDNLKYILNEVPSTNIKNSLQNYIREKSKLLNIELEKLRKLQTQKTKFETAKRMHSENFLKKLEELKELEQKILNVTKGENFDEGLVKIETNLKNNQDNKGHLMAVDYMFKKYIEKLQRENPDCPLCHRCFDEQSEVDELITEMDTKLGMIPEKMVRITQAMTEAEKDFSLWLQLKPIRDQANKLKTEEVSKIQHLIDEEDTNVKRLESEINEMDELVESLSSDKNIGDSLVCDASTIDQINTDIAQLNSKIKNIQAKLNNKVYRSLNEAQMEKKELQLKLEMSIQQLEHKRLKLNDQAASVQRLKASINELKCEQLSIESKLQDRCRLEATRTQLICDNESLIREIKNIREDLSPITKTIDKMNLSKEKLIEKNHQQIEIKTNKLNKIKNTCDKIENLQIEVDRYRQENIDEKRKKCEENLSKMEKQLEDLNLERLQFISKIESNKQLLIDKKMRYRELEDNMLLLKYELDLSDLNNKVEKEKLKFGGLDVDNFLNEKTKLNEEAVKLRRERDVFISRQQVLEGEITTLSKDLSTDQFKEAEDKYRNMMIMLKTTELANSDLDKYYKALDRIIMSYHCQKMTDINKIIKHLWKTTYKGHDIDTIEIRSSEDDGSGAAKSRRSYNYRVVMLKGGIELDMRGRCSAGQKVLASIIIRLALAETFCLNCGVLALDEPTTNLDRENIESLATALVEIITLRSEQRNFQLIVITHDEDFVELLGRSQYVEEFFRVSKCEKTGYSRLTQSNIQDLQTK